MLAGGFLVVVLALIVNGLTGAIAFYATPVPLRQRRTLYPWIKPWRIRRT